MLPYIETSTKKLEKYRGIISDKLFEEIKDLARDLKGLRVTMINSTPRGGGVAEILEALIPLMKGVGINAHWHVIPPGRKFFGLTKEIHNALQGKEYFLSFQYRRLYNYHMERAAKLMLDMKSDIWVLHDPQPVGIIHYLPNFHPSISHIHIDTSNPNTEAWHFIESFLLRYDRIIFSAKDFVYRTIPKKKVTVFPPAINPLSSKNYPLSPETAKKILESFRINPKKPLMTQVSRFDPWKDPLGVIKTYYLAKKQIPDLQLALVGLFLAHDDPEAIKVFREARKWADGDPNIFLFSDPEELGSLKVNIFVNAFQTGSDVILQKSIKEGFGLCVLPNTEILTEKGPKIIKSIIKGDRVLAEDGEFHKVKDKISRIVNKYFEITTWKGIKVGATKEHPFLSTSKSRKVKITENDLEWKRADRLSEGDFVAVPIPRSNEENILIDLAEYDEDVLSDDTYVYYKFGFSGKREFSYKNLSERLNESKAVIEGAVRHLRGNEISRSHRQNTVLKELTEIEFNFPEVEKIKRFIPLNPEIQWFIGWYIAEGDTNGHMIEINGNLQEINRIIKLQEIAQRYFGKKGTIDKRDTRVRLIISSKILSKFFSTFGKSAGFKHIPDNWMHLGKHLKWIVLGILEGDGRFLESWGELTTTSKKLAWQAWQILLADKIPSKISKENNSRGFKTSNPLFYIRFGGREYHRFCKETVNKFGDNPSRVKSRLADFAVILDHFVLLPIRKIRKVSKETKVYDISVEGTHSFVGNGYLLHNTVAEAMWKEKPVIGGNVGGIKTQIKNGKNGFLVSSPEEAAKRIVQLLQNPALVKKIGTAAHQTVKEKFLMPRLLRDYLKLFRELVKNS